MKPFLSTKNHNSKREEKIDQAGRKISNAMVKGLKKLAALIDVEFLEVLPHVFGDESAQTDAKVNLILVDAKEIYERGELALKKLDRSNFS